MSVPARKALWAAGLASAIVLAAAIQVSNHFRAFTLPLNELPKEISARPDRDRDRKTSKAVVQAETQVRPTRMVNLTLYEQGIFPRKIRVQPGRIIFSIDDRHGYASGVVISRAGRRNRVGNAPGRRAKGIIELEAGVYQLSDASRPENRAELIVEP